MRRLYSYILSIFFLAIFGHISGAQTLAISDFMGGHDYVGHLPQAPFWAGNSERFYFYWNPEGKEYEELYQWEKGTDAPTKVAGDGKKERTATHIDWREETSLGSQSFCGGL